MEPTRTGPSGRGARREATDELPPRTLADSPGGETPAAVADAALAGGAPRHDSFRPPRRLLVVGGAAAVTAGSAAWLASRRPLPGDTRRGGADGADAGGPRVGREAPNFVLPDPAGKRVELKQFRGRPVLLNFWATWCAPCKEEMPEFEQVYRQYKEQGLVVLAVSADDASTAQRVPDYLKEGHPRVGSYTFSVALDTKQEVVRTYRLLGLPGTFFIDTGGVVRALYQGALSRQMILDRLRTILPAA